MESQITSATRGFKFETYWQGVRNPLRNAQHFASNYCICQVGHSIYVIGKVKYDSDCNVCRFDVRNGAWAWTKKIQGEGDVGLFGYESDDRTVIADIRCILYGSELYFFGGCTPRSKKEEYMKQIGRFDLVLLKWLTVELAGEPIPQRTDGTVEFLESANCAVIFGGCFERQNDMEQAILDFDFELGMDFMENVEDIVRGDLVFVEMESLRQVTMVVRGRQPGPRRNHASCSSYDKVFIFSGRTSDDIQLNDLHVLAHHSIAVFTWSQPLETSMEARPIPRCSGTISFISPSLLIIYGGYSMHSESDPWIVDLSHGKPMWKPINSRGEYWATGRLPRSAGHCAVTSGSVIYILGASSPFPSSLRISAAGTVSYYADLVLDTLHVPQQLRNFNTVKRELREGSRMLGRTLCGIELFADAEGEEIEETSEEDTSDDESEMVEDIFCFPVDLIE